jgi:hypothetical protein
MPGAVYHGYTFRAPADRLAFNLCIGNSFRIDLGGRVLVVEPYDFAPARMVLRSRPFPVYNDVCSHNDRRCSTAAALSRRANCARERNQKSLFRIN